jgi:glucosylceramidase
LPPGGWDPALKRFSVAHDRDYILPLIRQALRINPSLRIIASPWSPPAWMKTNSALTGRSANGEGRLRPEAYGPLSLYFVKFLRAYRAAGVAVWALTPQNEPDNATADYPGMLMSPREQAVFISRYLIPRLRAARIRVRILGYDSNWFGYENYADLATRAGADGLAFHCYFGSPEAMAAYHAQAPAALIVEDECSVGSGIDPVKLILDSLTHWASGVLFWNLALDPDGGPKVGSGCPGCVGVVTIEPKKRSVAYTRNYHALGHVSRFAAGGAHVVKATTAMPSDLQVAAFEGRGGRTALVVSNTAATGRRFVVHVRGTGYFSYRLPGALSGQPIATFVWRGRTVRR